MVRLEVFWWGVKTCVDTKLSVSNTSPCTTHSDSQHTHTLTKWTVHHHCMDSTHNGRPLTKFVWPLQFCKHIWTTYLITYVYHCYSDIIFFKSTRPAGIQSFRLYSPIRGMSHNGITSQEPHFCTCTCQTDFLKPLSILCHRTTLSVFLQHR